MIIFLFRTYESGHRLVTIIVNKRTTIISTTSVTIHGSCCWHVTMRTYGGENETEIWNRHLKWNERPSDKKTVGVITFKIKEC